MSAESFYSADLHAGLETFINFIRLDVFILQRFRFSTRVLPLGPNGDSDQQPLDDSHTLSHSTTCCPSSHHSGLNKHEHNYEAKQHSRGTEPRAFRTQQRPELCGVEPNGTPSVPTERQHLPVCPQDSFSGGESENAHPQCSW